MESPSDKSELVLSFDLGGGTFDLSLMAVTGDSLEVVAYGGDMHLGGQDFDYNLQQWFIKVARSHRVFILRSQNLARLSKAGQHPVWTLLQWSLAAMAGLP